MSLSSRRGFGSAVSSLLALAWGLTYLYLGTTSNPPTIGVGGRVDLLGHLGASVVLALLVADALGGTRRARWVWAAIVSFLVGLAIEAVQTGVPTRDFDWLDLVLDAVGSAVGATAHRAASSRLEPRMLSAGVAGIGLVALLTAGLMLVSL